MKFVKKFESFLREEFTAAEPVVKPSEPVVLPGIEERPAPPQITPGQDQSPFPAPAKAETATAEDVAMRFIELINKSGDDIKKYVEIK